MQRLFAFVVVFGVATSALAPTWSQAKGNEYVVAIAEAQRELVDDLEALADWCRANKLLLEADLCYRNLLRIDAEHARARASLRFTKRKGVWVQASSYRQPKNYSSEALVPFAAKRLETMEPYKRTILDLNAAHAKTVPVERRERVLLELLELTPDDPDVRLALGEALVGGEWRLVETKNTFERASVIAELAQRCLATSPPGREVEPNGLEQTIALPWSLILANDYMRVGGTGSPDEVRNVMRVTQAAGELFRTVFGNDALPGVNYALYLLESDEQKRQFFDNHPSVRPADRPFLEQLESAGIPGANQCVESARGEDLRLDHSVRQTFGTLMTDTYGITLENGWAWEGFGSYLTYHLIGTRLTFYLRQGKYAVEPSKLAEQEQLFSRLYMPGNDWMGEARIYFADGAHKPPKLSVLMGRKVDSMTVEDLLWSYVVASYLIEGWPEKTPAFLKALGKGKQAPAEAIRSVFDMELPRLEQRVVRWLDETR